MPPWHGLVLVACLAMMGAASNLPAYAQSLTPQSPASQGIARPNTERFPNLPRILVRGDTIISDEARQVVEAQGNVEIVSATKHWVRADNIAVNLQQRIIVASGDVTVFVPNGEGGYYFFANYLKLNGDWQVVNSDRIVLRNEKNLRVVARSARLVERKGVYYLEMYLPAWSYCTECPRDEDLPFSETIEAPPLPAPDTLASTTDQIILREARGDSSGDASGEKGQTIDNDPDAEALAALNSPPDAPPQTLFWEFLAEETRLDSDDQILVFNKVQLEILGVPVLYVPYAWVRVENEEVVRRWGLLPPTFGSTSNNKLGFTFTPAIFAPITESSDITFGVNGSPISQIATGAFLYRREGVHNRMRFSGSLGQLPKEFEYDKSGVIIPSSKIGFQTTGHARLESTIEHSDRLRTITDAVWQSHDNYLPNFGFVEQQADNGGAGRIAYVQSTSSIYNSMETELFLPQSYYQLLWDWWTAI